MDNIKDLSQTSYGCDLYGLTVSVAFISNLCQIPFLPVLLVSCFAFPAAIRNVKKLLKWGSLFPQAFPQQTQRAWKKQPLLCTQDYIRCDQDNLLLFSFFNMKHQGGWAAWKWVFCFYSLWSAVVLGPGLNWHFFWMVFSKAEMKIETIHLKEDRTGTSLGYSFIPFLFIDLHTL